MPVLTRSMCRKASMRVSMHIPDNTHSIDSKPSIKEDYETYKNNTIKLERMSSKTENGKLLNAKLCENAILYMNQDDMLKMANTAGWYITWISNIKIRKDIYKPVDTSIYDNAIANLQKHLCSRYCVSLDEFNRMYDFMIDWIGEKEEKNRNICAAELMSYMTKVMGSLWEKIPLEKKFIIRARVWFWKTLPDTNNLVKNCDRFLEDYTMLGDDVDTETYKKNSLALHDIYSNKYHKKPLHHETYRVVMEYIAQPDMLKKAHSCWIISWMSSLLGTVHMKDYSSMHMPFVKNAYDIFKIELENERHYVSNKVMSTYDWYINFIYGKKEEWMNMYAAAVMPWMIRAFSGGVWCGVDLEKKSMIIARVKMWKDLEAPKEYKLKELCDEFLEKYKMV